MSLLLYVLAASETSPSPETHTWEIVLAWGTVALTLITLITALVTGLLTWVSWKLYKVDSEKSKHISDNATELSENALKGMTEVATVAITHSERLKRLNKIRRGKGL